MAEMTPEEYANWVLNQQNLAANEYGRPWINDGTDDFKELGYTTSGLKDIGSIAGIQWSDFYNIPEAPEMPTDTPYQSDYIQAIGGENSLPALIAEGVREGLTPQAAAATVVRDLPDHPAIQGWKAMTPDEKNMIYGQAVKYNEEALRQNREQSDYDTQMQQYDNWFQPGNLWDEAGYTDQASFVDTQRGGALPESVTRVKPSAKMPNRPGDANGVFSDVGQTRWFEPGNLARQVAVKQALADNPMLGGYRSSGANASGAVQASALDRMAQVAQQKMQAAQTPSQDEQAKRARLAAAYSLITGSPAPR